MFVSVWKGLAGHIQKWNELESIAIVCLLRALIYEGSGAQYNHPNNHLVSERTRQAAKRHKNIIDNRACSGLSADARGGVPPTTTACQRSLWRTNEFGSFRFRLLSDCCSAWRQEDGLLLAFGFSVKMLSTMCLSWCIRTFRNWTMI